MVLETNILGKQWKQLSLVLEMMHWLIHVDADWLRKKHNTTNQYIM